MQTLLEPLQPSLPQGATWMVAASADPVVARANAIAPAMGPVIGRSGNAAFRVRIR